MRNAFDEMEQLEAGAIANADEGRMVGHYWLRNPGMAPNAGITREITEMNTAVITFSKSIHEGRVRGAWGTFENALVIGIGGSALGPQLVARAMARPGKEQLKMYFLDNTDPDGIDLLLAELKGKLGRTLTVVISKSGGTKETRNGMVEVKRAYEQADLKFEQHAVAVTGLGSELDKVATNGGWIRRFPMWDWVGGRTSLFSAVGLLPANLQGVNTELFIEGSAASDRATRSKDVRRNPAAMLALMWFLAGNGKGSKDMVVLPYKDRLELFSKYLQQLVMESLGKERDRSGKVVNQGLAVYGNKGSTDQHAYVQQLREGLDNFFVTFVTVLRAREADDFQVEPGISSGDYLNGFYLGTREALSENGRQSISISIDVLDESRLGTLIALFERAVGFYATLINVNAYHQPGVEAGKKAAARVIELQGRIRSLLFEKRPQALKISEIATSLNCGEEPVFLVCEHLAASQIATVERIDGQFEFEMQYRAK